MLLINIIHNFCIFFGMCLFGNFIIEKFLRAKVWNTFQEKLCLEFVSGFILISLLLYLISIFNFFIIGFSILINLVLIIFSIVYIYKKKFEIKIKFNLVNNLLFLIIIILFISTLLPITDADTIAYHLEIPQKIIENKKLNYSNIDYHEIFYGPGESIYLLGVIFKNYQIPQFINFIALMILYLTIQSKIKFKNYKNKSFFIFGLLSSPILFQLFLSVKPQLIFISINVLIFSLLQNLSEKKINFDKSFSHVFFIFLIFVSLTIILTKITFIFTTLFIILYFLSIINNILKLKVFYIIILSTLFLLFIILLKKNNIYGVHSLYFIPSTFLNFDQNFLNFLTKIKLKNNYSHFPLNLFIPLSKSALLDNLGLISLFFPLFFFYFRDNNSKEIFLIFALIFISIMFGLKRTRFLLSHFL